MATGQTSFTIKPAAATRFWRKTAREHVQSFLRSPELLAFREAILAGKPHKALGYLEGLDQQILNAIEASARELAQRKTNAAADTMVYEPPEILSVPDYAINAKRMRAIFDSLLQQGALPNLAGRQRALRALYELMSPWYLRYTPAEMQTLYTLMGKQWGVPPESLTAFERPKPFDWRVPLGVGAGTIALGALLDRAFSSSSIVDPAQDAQAKMMLALLGQQQQDPYALLGLSQFPLWSRPAFPNRG